MLVVQYDFWVRTGLSVHVMVMWSTEKKGSKSFRASSPSHTDDVVVAGRIIDPLQSPQKQTEVEVKSKFTNVSF